MGGQRHASVDLLLGNRPGVHRTGGWLGPRVGLDGYGNSRTPPPTGIRSPDRTARSEWLYRLRYPGVPAGLCQLFFRT